MSAKKIPEIAAIAQDGDTLVFGFRDDLDRAEAEEVRDHLRARLEPLGVQVLIVTGVESITAVRPGDPGSPP